MKPIKKGKKKGKAIKAEETPRQQQQQQEVVQEEEDWDVMMAEPINPKINAPNNSGIGPLKIEDIS